MSEHGASHCWVLLQCYIDKHRMPVCGPCDIEHPGCKLLIEAFAHNFPFAKQLCCFIHIKKNISTNLKDNGIPPSVSQEFVSDVFGKCSGETHEESLADSVEHTGFDSCLQNCKDVWNTQVSLRMSRSNVILDYFKSVSC